MSNVRASAKLPLVFGWAAGQDGWGGDMNQNIAILSAFTHPVIESLTFSSPPPQAAEWDLYVVGANPLGPWAGHEGRIAMLLSGAWLFVDPPYGFEARLRSTDTFVWYDGAQWLDRETGEPSEGGGSTDGLPIGQKILVSRPGAPLAGERFVFPIDEPMVLPAGADRSLAYCEVPPAASVFFRLYRNTAEIGTITFEAGDFSGSYSVPSSITLGAGDRLVLAAPADNANGIADTSFVIRLLFTGN